MVSSFIWTKRHGDTFFMNASDIKPLSVFRVHKLDIILSRNMRLLTIVSDSISAMGVAYSYRRH